MNAIGSLTTPRPCLRERMRHYRRMLYSAAAASARGSDVLLIAADALEECWRHRTDNAEPMALVRELRGLAPRYAGAVPVAPAPASQASVTWATLIEVAHGVRPELEAHLGIDGADRVLGALEDLDGAPGGPAEMPHTLRVILARVPAIRDPGQALVDAIRCSPFASYSAAQAVLQALTKGGWR